MADWQKFKRIYKTTYQTPSDVVHECKEESNWLSSSVYLGTIKSLLVSYDSLVALNVCGVFITEPGQRLESGNSCGHVSYCYFALWLWFSTFAYHFIPASISRKHCSQIYIPFDTSMQLTNWAPYVCCIQCFYFLSGHGYCVKFPSSKKILSMSSVGEMKSWLFHLTLIIRS